MALPKVAVINGSLRTDSINKKLALAIARLAAGKLDQFGTLEVGKLADLLILGANPLTDIANIRSVETVVTDGRIIDPATLPTKPRG